MFFTGAVSDPVQGKPGTADATALRQFGITIANSAWAMPRVAANAIRGSVARKWGASGGMCSHATAPSRSSQPSIPMTAMPEASVLSFLYRWIEMLELDTSVYGCEVPVNPRSGVISIHFPRSYLTRQGVLIRDTSAQTLPS